MVYKRAGPYSFYGYVNQRQRNQRHPFEVRGSPTPSPELTQDSAQIFAQQPSSPAMSIQSGGAGRAVPGNGTMQHSSPSISQETSTRRASQSKILTNQSSARGRSAQHCLQGPTTPNSNLTQASSPPAKSQQISFTEHAPTIKTEHSSPAMPKARLLVPPASPASPTPRPTAQPRSGLTMNPATIQALRRNRGIANKPTPPRQPFEDPSSDEAEEAPIVEAVDLGSRSKGIAAAALFRKDPTPPERQVTPQDDPIEVTDVSIPVEKVQVEIVGVEHRQFYMHMRRSLRGCRTTDGAHTGSKLHIVSPEDYFEMCDVDELFGDDDDSASMSTGRNSRKHNKGSHVGTSNADRVGDVMNYDQMDIVESPVPRVRTRPKAPSSVTRHKQNEESSIPQSDAEAQKYFSNWTAQLVKSNESLTSRLEASENRVEELKAVISIKDEDIEKLEARLQKHKQRATNEAQIANLKTEVGTLRAQLATAQTQAVENRTRYTQQIAAVANMSADHANEKSNFERQLQDLQHQINVLRSRPRATPPIPSSPFAARPYSSPLRAAIARETPSASPPVPTVEASKYKALYDAANSVVVMAEVKHMIGNPMIADFGQLLQDLKDELEKLPKPETL